LLIIILFPTSPLLNSISSSTYTRTGYRKKWKTTNKKRLYNANVTLEDTADFIEQKRKEDFEAVVYTIKNRFRTSSGGIKKLNATLLMTKRRKKRMLNRMLNKM
jgi:hypothetical protein